MNIEEELLREKNLSSSLSNEVKRLRKALQFYSSPVLRISYGKIQEVHDYGVVGLGDLAYKALYTRHYIGEFDEQRNKSKKSRNNQTIS